MPAFQVRRRAERPELAALGMRVRPLLEVVNLDARVLDHLTKLVPKGKRFSVALRFEPVGALKGVFLA